MILKIPKHQDLMILQNFLIGMYNTKLWSLEFSTVKILDWSNQDNSSLYPMVHTNKSVRPKGWFSVGICKYKPGYKSHEML